MGLRGRQDEPQGQARAGRKGGPQRALPVRVRQEIQALPRCVTYLIRESDDSLESYVDPYAERPSFWSRHEAGVWAAGIFVLTVVLTVFSFPPYPTPEFAYAFASPAIFWAYMRPSFRLYAVTMFAAQAVAWTMILGWLHNVTWGGL